MKSFLSFLLAITFLSSIHAQTAGDQLFDPSVIHEIRFESPDELFFNQLLGSWMTSPLGENPDLLGTVRLDGQLIDSVGVRIKGGLSAFNQKKPLKIDFNAFVAGKAYDGIKKINLLNADFDAPLQRDILGYHIFRKAGVKSSRAAYAKVFFNQTYHGVYILVEQVDKTFLDEMFASEEGTLYKNKECSVVVDSGEETLSYFQEMVGIANNLSGQAFQSAIEEVLDTEAFLRFFLIENFINASDNPIDVGCNYYVYRIPNTGKLYWIPWDLNYAFYSGQNYPLFHPSNNMIFKKMMTIPAYRQRYAELACEMLDYLFLETELHTFIDQNAQLIRAEVAIDPRYDFDMDAFDLGVERLKSLISARRLTFLQDLAAESFSCPDFTSPVAPLGISINEIVASNDSLGGIPDPHGQYPDWIELYNNTSDTISLNGFYLSNDQDFPKHWAFPSDASIAPGGYQIVWADKDLEQIGLHTDFKLDKKSGHISLIYEDFSLVDEVNYGAQTTNIGYARVPNGLGPFQQQAPTFEKNNEGISKLSEISASQQLSTHVDAGQTLHVELAGQGLGQLKSFGLYDILGRRVANVDTTAPNADFKVGHLPAGIWVVSVAFEHQYVAKLVILGSK